MNGLDIFPPCGMMAARSIETPLATVAKPLFLAFFARRHAQKTRPDQAGNGLIAHPQGEYARRSQAVSSSRPFSLGNAKKIEKLARRLMSSSPSPSKDGVGRTLPFLMETVAELRRDLQRQKELHQSLRDLVHTLVDRQIAAGKLTGEDPETFTVRGKLQ
jgi:hypothetical protein